jgi:hypothetical protein
MFKHKLSLANIMVISLIIFAFVVYCGYLYISFCEKRTKVLEYFKKCEDLTKSRILYIGNSNMLYLILGELHEFIINIDNEDKTGNFVKKLHKIKGNLTLIIDFNKTELQKILPIIKALSAYSKLTENQISTYVPYIAKNSSSLIALAGKKIIMGNYATISNTKIDQLSQKVLEQYYTSSTVKKICENFMGPTDNSDTKYFTADELSNLKLNCVIENNLPENKDLLKNLMVEIERLFS